MREPESEEQKEEKMEIVLGGRRLMIRQGAHAYLKEKFGFPDYYGNNLDALYDCLTELDRGTRVRVRFAAELEEGGGYGAKILETLRDAAGEGYLELKEE
ncbi:MAG: barstar family protein [Lachnospiraceae bacterium]|nr:barstar family protein [Lachnospiraceae bacterium]